MGFKTLLREEIREELGELSNIELGSDEYEKAVNGVTKLMDRAIELEKVDIEQAEREETREIETNLKAQEMINDRKDRFVKNCIAVAGIVVPSVLTIWGTVKSIEFEKEGTITTIMGRGFIQKLLPKK